ncbi:MAG: beta-lactamase family protein, partial [Gammaproteobacteria bacterium]|nr:beta-lactamase family protein [Gammaproteobacteria bacterium]
MKNRLNFVLMIVWIVLGAVVMTLLPGGCAAAAPAPTSTSTLLPVRVMQAAHDRVASGQYPMLVIGVVNGDKSRLYGFNAEGEPAPHADTVFEIGSVTKTFTGLALALAVESGEVALDESVAELLPNFEIPSRNGKAITLENLATQHSGLPRLPGNLQPWKNPANPYADYGVMKLEAFLSGYELKHDPGSHYKYSNLGFGLLGYALARREGVGYGELLQRAILNPLNMNSCAVRLNEAMRKHLAAGHDASENVVSNWDMAVLSGAGGLKCSAADMMGYLKANM